MNLRRLPGVLTVVRILARSGSNRESIKTIEICQSKASYTGTASASRG